MADYLTEALKHGRKPSRCSRYRAEMQLGGALHDYTCKNSRSYDPAFDKKIRKLRPDWFENTADINKQKLLKLARSNGNRPSQKAKDMKERKLGISLSRHISRKSRSYDPAFDRKIRQLRPDWFENTADTKKERLLEIAQSNGKKPSCGANDGEKRLATALSRYTVKNGWCYDHGYYDQVFDRKIRKLRPDWFENTTDINKEKLLKLAKTGAKRPSNTAKDNEERTLGRALSGSTCNGKSRDPVFDARIRKLRPDWFENTADTKKEALLKLAKSKGHKPSAYSKDLNEKQLGRALGDYTNKNNRCYDPVFDRKVRQLRPDWFRRK